MLPLLLANEIQNAQAQYRSVMAQHQYVVDKFNPMVLTRWVPAADGSNKFIDGCGGIIRNAKGYCFGAPGWPKDVVSRKLSFRLII